MDLESLDVYYDLLRIFLKNYIVSKYLSKDISVSYLGVSIGRHVYLLRLPI